MSSLITNDGQTGTSDALFRVLVQSVKDYAIFLLDPQGRVQTWNAGAERIKGYTKDEIVGKSFSVFYPAAEARRGKPEYELRVAVEEGRYEEEGWRVRKDGSTFWASVVITTLRDDWGTVIGFAKVTRDLTERKKHEEELTALLERERAAHADSENALRRLQAIQSVTEPALAHLEFDRLVHALLERITEALAVDTAAILLLSDEGDVLVARAARGLEEEVERGVRIPLGQGFAGRIAAERRAIVLDDVEHAGVLNPILREKGVKSLMGVPLATARAVIGVLHVGTLRPTHFTPADVDFLQLVADRISLGLEHARLYEEATRARKDVAAATDALRLRDDFINLAAHELKTPITSTKTGIQLLQRSLRAAPLTASQSNMIATVERQISKLTRLVVQLLDMTRLRTGDLPLEAEEVDVAELVRSTVQAFQPVTDRHEIVVTGPDRLTAVIDPLRIEQVLTNLLDNAVKYSPAGGPIEVGIQEKAGTFWISVRDHGLGIPPEHRSQVFDRYYQAHPSRSGLGLGLYLCRGIVERHGGTIYAESPPDGGTRMVMSLPLRSVRAAPVAEPEAVTT